MATRPSVLVVPNTIFFPPYLEEIDEVARQGHAPRTWLNDIDADLTILDQRLRTNPPKWRKVIYRRLPMWVVQVLEAHRVGRHYDVVFVWSLANVSLVLALLLRLTRKKIVLVCLLTRVSESKKARLLKRAHPAITTIVLPPVMQREFAHRELGVPWDKLVGLPWTLDTDYWRLPDPEPEPVGICAAGGEMRDYRTLVKAMDGLDFPCQVAGVLDTSRTDWWNADDKERAAGEKQLPKNIAFGLMKPDELRDLYARSLFSVVPLKKTDSDNGITVMNEAWSMSRPVIVSEVAGQRDAFTDEEGISVAQGDVVALREAIVQLWNSPEKARAMGKAGRRLVEREKDNSVFSDGLTRIFREAAGMSEETRRATR